MKAALAILLLAAATAAQPDGWPPPLPSLPDLADGLAPPLPLPGGRAPARTLYNVQPDGTCGAPGQFLTVLVTGTGGSLANAACSLGFEGFPDPQPDDACDGWIFGKECARLAAGLVVTVGGFGRLTDSPDVGSILALLGLGKLESVGGLFFDVADGAKARAFDGLPRLARVEGSGLQLLGGRQVARAPALAGVKRVDGSLFAVSTALPSAAAFSALERVADSALLINNFNLTSLAGASNLTNVGGGLVLAANHRLRDVDGLARLAGVGGGVSIANNTRLVSLGGLASLASVGGKLHVANNPTLASLDGLGGVKAVGGVGGGGAAAATALAAAAAVRGAAPAPSPPDAAAYDGVAHADVSIVGNRVLWNVSALAGLGRCGGSGSGANASAAAPLAPRPSIQLEVYPTTGVPADAAAAVAANAAATRAARAALQGAAAADAVAAGDGGFTPDAQVPPLANDVDSPRATELAAAASKAAAAVGRAGPPTPRGFLVAAADPRGGGLPRVVQAAAEGDADASGGGFTSAGATEAEVAAARGEAVSGAAEDAADAAAAPAAASLAAAWASGAAAAEAALATPATSAAAPATAAAAGDLESELEAIMGASSDAAFSDSPYGPDAPADAAERDHPDAAGVVTTLAAAADGLAADLVGPDAPPAARREVAAALIEAAAADGGLAAAASTPARRRLASSSSRRHLAAGTSMADDDPAAPELPPPRGGASPAGDARRPAGPLARLVAATPLGAVLPAPPDVAPFAQLASGAAAGGPDMRPPWARAAAATPAADPADPPPDPRLAAALALKPDTRCLFTSWDDVCEYVRTGGAAIGEGHRWRADGTCVPYTLPPLGAAAPTGAPLRISGR